MAGCGAGRIGAMAMERKGTGSGLHKNKNNKLTTAIDVVIMNNNMREIKFRIPHKCQNGHFRWLYLLITDGFDNLTKWGEKHCNCPTGGFGEGFRPSGQPQFSVGLADSKGTWIYEGDVVQEKTSELIRYEIAYNAPSFYLQASRDRAYTWERQHTDRLEVIGNLHENPELLK